MAHDPADSKRSLAFDRARRTLILESVPASQDVRKQWLERFGELLAAMFPDDEATVKKPGLATRMFAAEVSIGSRDKLQALDLARELDDNWRAFVRDQAKVESCCYLDRLDGIWEWAVDLGNAFVTGQVRLKNAAFVAQERPDRPPFRRSGPDDRRYNRPAGGYPRRDGPPRPDGERKPWRDRGDEKPWEDRRGPGPGGNRPWEDRRGPGPGGNRPWQDRRGPPGPGGNRPWQDRRGPGPSGGGRKPYGSGPPRPGRPPKRRDDQD